MRRGARQSRNNPATSGRLVEPRLSLGKVADQPFRSDAGSSRFVKLHIVRSATEFIDSM